MFDFARRGDVVKAMKAADQVKDYRANDAGGGISKASASVVKPRSTTEKYVVALNLSRPKKMLDKCFAVIRSLASVNPALFKSYEPTPTSEPFANTLISSL